MRVEFVYDELPDAPDTVPMVRLTGHLRYYPQGLIAVRLVETSKGVKAFVKEMATAKAEIESEIASTFSLFFGDENPRQAHTDFRQIGEFFAHGPYTDPVRIRVVQNLQVTCFNVTERKEQVIGTKFIGPDDSPVTLISPGRLSMLDRSDGSFVNLTSSSPLVN